MWDKLNIDSFQVVDPDQRVHPPNSSLIKNCITFKDSLSIASSSIQELYKRRALVIALGSMVPFGGNDERRSIKYKSNRITNCIAYQQ
jgi:hypothetical protein